MAESVSSIVAKITAHPYNEKNFLELFKVSDSVNDVDGIFFCIDANINADV
jgi:hypothetical protein